MACFPMEPYISKCLCGLKSFDEIERKCPKSFKNSEVTVWSLVAEYLRENFTFHIKYYPSDTLPSLNLTYEDALNGTFSRDGYDSEVTFRPITRYSNPCPIPFLFQFGFWALTTERLELFDFSIPIYSDWPVFLINRGSFLEKPVFNPYPLPGRFAILIGVLLSVSLLSSFPRLAALPVAVARVLLALLSRQPFVFAPLGLLAQLALLLFGLGVGTRTAVRLLPHFRHPFNSLDELAQLVETRRMTVAIHSASTYSVQVLHHLHSRGTRRLALALQKHPVQVTQASWPTKPSADQRSFEVVEPLTELLQQLCSDPTIAVPLNQFDLSLSVPPHLKHCLQLLYVRGFSSRYGYHFVLPKATPHLYAINRVQEANATPGARAEGTPQNHQAEFTKWPELLIYESVCGCVPGVDVGDCRH